VTRTLLGHEPGFDAPVEWYALMDELVPYIGERAFALFAYAISDAQDSPACAGFFRRILVESGDHPDAPEVTETEQLLLDWGRLVTTVPAEVPAALSARVEETFSPVLRGLLVAFAGRMVETARANAGTDRGDGHGA
jgi:hypothetical protein